MSLCKSSAYTSSQFSRGQKVDTRRLNSELRKLSVDEKLNFADQLLREVQIDITDDKENKTVDANNNNAKVKLDKLNILYDSVRGNNNNETSDVNVNNDYDKDDDGYNSYNGVDGINHDISDDDNCDSNSDAVAKLKKTEDNYSYQDTEFDNPFNTNPPETPGPFQSDDGTWHYPALEPDCYTPLKLTSVNRLDAQQSEYEFALPHSTDYTGCIPGQYIKVRVTANGKYCERFFSPVSATKDFGKIVLMLKYETNGELTKKFQAMEIGLTYFLIFIFSNLFIS